MIDSMVCLNFGILLPLQPDFISDAYTLHHELGLPMTKNKEEYPFILLAHANEGWGIWSRHFPNMKPLQINFLSSSWQRRLKEVGGKKDLLGKILKNVPRQLVVDATMGLGRDTFHFLALGFKVLAIERHPILFQLLQFAYQRSLHHCDPKESYFSSLLHQLTLKKGDAIDFFEVWSEKEKPQVIFLDPMFFQKKNSSALSGKEMQIFQIMQQQPEDLHQQNKLIYFSLKLAVDRVIIKRPLYEPVALPGEKTFFFQGEEKSIKLVPRHTYKGKSVRYDVYFPDDHCL